MKKVPYKNDRRRRAHLWHELHIRLGCGQIGGAFQSAQRCCVSHNTSSKFPPPPGKLKSKSAERIGLGQGFLSVLARITLDWEDDLGKLPRNVVLKAPTLNSLEGIMDSGEEFAVAKETLGDNKMDVWLTPAHNNECYMYELLR